MDLGACVQHGFRQMVKGRDIALHLGFQAQLATSAKNGDAVIAQGPRKDDYVPNPPISTTELPTRRKEPHPAGIDVQPVRLALLNNFGISGHDLNPCLDRRQPHRVDNLPQ